MPAIRPRRSSAERRVQIAEAALRLLGRGGTAAVRAETLAAAVGLTPGALFRHFPTHDAVLAAAVEVAAARLERTFPPAGLPPLERLLPVADRRVRLVAAEPALLWMLRSDQACRELPETATAPLRAVVSRSRRFLLGALRDGAADGSIRDDLPPGVLLTVVTGTVHALLGSPGLHGRAPAAAPRAVLRGLRRLLAPPAPPRAASPQASQS